MLQTKSRKHHNPDAAHATPQQMTKKRSILGPSKVNQCAAQRGIDAHHRNNHQRAIVCDRREGGFPRKTMAIAGKLGVFEGWADPANGCGQSYSIFGFGIIALVHALSLWLIDVGRCWLSCRGFAEAVILG